MSVVNNSQPLAVSTGSIPFRPCHWKSQKGEINELFEVCNIRMAGEKPMVNARDDIYAIIHIQTFR